MLKLLKIQQITPSQREALSELLTKKVDQYSPSITFLTKTQKDKFEKRCLEENIHKSYEINVNYKYKNDKNKIFFLIYLTKEKAKENIKALKNEKKYVIKFSGLHFKKVCRETLNNNYKFKHVFDDIMQNQGDDNPPTYFPPRDNYWSMPLSNELNFFKQPTQKTITINDRRKRSNKNKDFIKNLNIKDKIDNYYPKLIYLSKKVLKNYLSKVKKIIKAEKIFGEKKLVKNKKLFILGFVSLINFDKSKGFIFYLTKKQIKNLEETRKQGFFYGKMSLFFTTNQLLKTYKEVLKINSYLYYYNDIGRFYNKKSDIPKLLAITDKPYNKEELLNFVNIIDLIDFGNEEKDLIDFGNEEKDLIDFNIIIPNKKPTAQDLLMDEELFPKGKKYKLLQNKDLIPTITNPTTNGVNILSYILKSPETKRILGISLTSDIKEKIENLNSEASFGLASILSSLLSANRGKMSIYSISRKQLKEIIEGFITTLSVILNPTQKY